MENKGNSPRINKEIVKMNKKELEEFLMPKLRQMYDVVLDLANKPNISASTKNIYQEIYEEKYNEIREKLGLERL